MKLAMAVRGQNKHYRLDVIERRHFNAAAKRSSKPSVRNCPKAFLSKLRLDQQRTRNAAKRHRVDAGRMNVDVSACSPMVTVL
jgi:hypothetical protein